MKFSITHYQSPFRVSRFAFRVSAPAFSLMELMVSIAILVMIILAVGVTFSGASQTVGTSQAVMEEMASVRAAQLQIDRDFQGLDRNGFLVIRSRLNNTTQGDRSLRFDQVSFISLGEFPNRTGADTASPFTDSSVANAAFVWIGQGVMEMDASRNPDKSYLSPPNQGAVTPQAQLPTGAYDDAGGTRVIKENEFTLLNHKTLLYGSPLAAGGSYIMPAGQQVMAYPGIELSTAPIAGSAEGTTPSYPAHISSSRYSAATQTPSQVMQFIAGYHSAGEPTPEYDRFTYRFRALASVYDTEVATNPFVNGYFRTTPIVMTGVSSFRVEWTDGHVFTSAQDPNRAGQVKWYGPSLPSGGAPLAGAGTDNTATDNNVEAYWNATPNTYGDHYVAIFSYMNKAKWPKALRISMHVANDRIGGRDFVQVINLP